MATIPQPTLGPCRVVNARRNAVLPHLIDVTLEEPPQTALWIASYNEAGRLVSTLWETCPPDELRQVDPARLTSLLEGGQAE
jgi:hypothetical protein